MEEHIEQATAAPGEVRKLIHGGQFGQMLIDAGILPANTKRVIIDAEVSKVVTVYYECFGDARLLKIGIEDALLKDVEVVRANDVEG